MKKYFFLTLFALVLLAGLALFQYTQYYDNKLHVVFCNVGQGDGIVIKTPSNKYILVDAGPDKRILDCLAKHMPFWNRTIDLMILSHPHADHFMGMHFVLERYNVVSFATEDLVNKAPSFQHVLAEIKANDIPIRHVFAGDLWRLSDGVILSVVGPTAAFLKQTSPGGVVGESKEFGNVILHVVYERFGLLLTGDSQAKALSEAIGMVEGSVAVLQSPHHGSATGLNETIIKSLQPSLAVISVGRNRYGHPTKRILDLFEEKEIKVLRTDKWGDVEIISDGKEWQLNKAH